MSNDGFANMDRFESISDLNERLEQQTPRRRPVVQRFRVQSDLNVVVEDSMNILLEVVHPNTGDVILRTNPITNVDRLEQMLHLARVSVADATDPVPTYRIEETCCGKCTGGTCYVDQVTGA